MKDGWEVVGAFVGGLLAVEARRWDVADEGPSVEWRGLAVADVRVGTKSPNTERGTSFARASGVWPDIVLSVDGCHQCMNQEDGLCCAVLCLQMCVYACRHQV